MKTKLKVGVIGLGSMGYNHARVYSDIEGVELVAISDTSRSCLNSSKKFCSNLYENYLEMIDKEKFDIISIVVPTDLHKRVAIDVMNRGINVLLEKPIASTIKEAEEIIACAAKNSIKLTIGHIERFNPAILELKKRLDRSELGKVYKVDINRIGPFPARIRDVGVVIDLAVHDIDILRYLLDSEINRVYAETEKQIHTDHEDLLSGLIKFDNSVIAHLNINWLTPTKIRKVYVTGEKGMFVVNYISQELLFYENAHFNGGVDRKMGISEGKMTRFLINKKEPLRLELESFVEAVTYGNKPLVGGEDGLIALKVARDLVNSSNKGAVVKCNK